MRFILHQILFLNFLLSNTLQQIMSIYQHIENLPEQQILFVQVILSQKTNFSLILKNARINTQEEIQCTASIQCFCNNKSFKNIKCTNQKDETIIFNSEIYPYIPGQEIYSQNIYNDINLNSYVNYNTNRNLQSQNYTSQDLSSSLQIGSYPTFIKWQIYQENNTFDMAIEQNSQHWLGLGFCPSMTNCDMLLIYLMNQSVIVVDSFSTGHSSPLPDQQQDIVIESQMINQTGYAVRFNRKLNTGDKFDQILIQGNVYTFSIAWSNDKVVQEHTVWYNFDITFDNNIVGIAMLLNQVDILYFIHAIILFIAWGVLVDLGILVIRFFKTLKYYILIHSIIFTIIDLSTVILVILLLCIDISAGNIDDGISLDIHSTLALIILSLVIVQHLFGILIKYQLESKSKINRQNVFIIKKLHQFIGLLLYISSKIMLITGFIVNGYQILLILAIIWFSLLIILRIILETYWSIKNSLVDNTIESDRKKKLTQDQEKLLKLLETDMSTQEIIKSLPKMRWIILNQDIFDVTNFQHPGGNFIISNVIGKEISRYFYGAFSLEFTSIHPHLHSQLAFNSLKSYYIGTISQQKIADNSISWEQIDQIRLSKNISLIYFKSSSFKIKLYQDVQQFGKHFSLSFQQQGSKIRMYTKVLCMTQPYEQFRNQVITFYENNTGILPKLEIQETNIIPLIIKKYNFPNALSQQIFSDKGAQFWIQGPFGRGLELKKNSKCIALVGGTGLLPFLDLLDHLLMKSIYCVMKDQQEQINQFFPQHDQLGDEFELTILASFNKVEEFVGKDWIRKLFEINKANKLRIFDMFVRYSKQNNDDIEQSFTERFTEEFIKSYLGDFNKQVYICGPPNMIYSISKILLNTPQNREKIMIV